jgi:hypothetical protein
MCSGGWFRCFVCCSGQTVRGSAHLIGHPLRRFGDGTGDLIATPRAVCA